MDVDDIEALEAELIRIGLNFAELPGLVTNGPQAFRQFLQHLRTLPEGASWHDVFPELPKKYRSPLDQLRNAPYLPLGPWDHQELPTAPAVHVGPKDHATPISLADLDEELRRAGLEVHAVGRLPSVPDTHAWVVLPRGATEDAFGAVLEYFGAHPRLEIYTVPRTGEEAYPAEPSDTSGI